MDHFNKQLMDFHSCFAQKKKTLIGKQGRFWLYAYLWDGSPGTESKYFSLSKKMGLVLNVKVNLFSCFSLVSERFGNMSA